MYTLLPELPDLSRTARNLPAFKYSCKFVQAVRKSDRTLFLAIHTNLYEVSLSLPDDFFVPSVHNLLEREAAEFAF